MTKLVQNNEAIQASFGRHPLERFFNPARMAFIGASDDQSKFGGRCLANLTSFGYRGEVFPINPKRQEIFGYRCYASVDELPALPDHVGIALPGAAAVDAIERCGKIGVPFATLFTAGFLETGTAEGAALQQRLRRICQDTGIRVMGPNCNGLINFIDRFALTSTAAVQGAPRESGDVAIVSQSGGAGQISVLWRGMQAGLRMSYQVSSGNDADLDLLDYLDYMLESEQTTVVLALVERLSDGAKLKAVAEKAVRLDKPIVMLKVGRSAAGARAAASHTGAITGSDDICDAALRQYGIIRVNDTTELYEYAKVLRRHNRPRGRRIAAASISGGNLVLSVDLACQAGLEWPDFAPATSEALKVLVPGFGTVRNPIDLTTAAIGTVHTLVTAGKAMLADPAVDVFVPLMTMARRDELEAVADLALSSEKATVLLWTGGCIDDPGFTAESLVARGLSVFRDSAPCFSAIAASARVSQYRAGQLDRKPITPRIYPASPALPKFSGSLTERDSKALLAHFGLPTTQEALARTADEAIAIAKRFGRPVALKIESPDIPHKTEAGAIRLNVSGDDAVRDAFDAVLCAARAHAPQAALQGVLVQEMAGAGMELLLGLVVDPVFGPVITVGAGGIYVEVLRDVTRRVAPVDLDEAQAMLRSLRIWPILQGYRGQAAYDVEAVAACITGLSDLAMSLSPQIAEIDVNPLIVGHAGQGARVVDALVVCADAANS